MGDFEGKVAADVSVEGEVERLVAEAIDRRGRLDIAVDNAGTESTAELAGSRPPQRPATRTFVASIWR